MEIIQKKSSLTANNMDSSLTSFLQHHPDGAYIKNLAGDIIFQNHNLPIFTDLAAQAESVEEKVRTADTAVANVEINAKKENGTTHTLSMTCTPWMQDNRISGTISQFRDITEERAKEIALAESTNLMQLVLEHLPVRVFWKNQDLVYMGMNTVFANDMGFERPDQLIGHDDYHTNMTHEEADICRADDFYVLESREGRYGAEEVIRSEEADDGISWIRVSKVPLHNAAGSMIGVLGMYEDVGQQKRAQIELETALHRERELNELKTRFISMVSHEYRNPLAIIQINAETLLKLDQHIKPEMKEKQLKSILHTTKRMTQLMENTLFIGREDLQELSKEYVAVNMEILVNNVLQELTPQDQSRINFNIKQNQQPIIGIPPHLTQLVHNLISNALKYSSDVIQITLDSHDSNCLLTVTDQGIGIPTEDQPHIFDSFFRSQNVGQVEGNGLGLYIVKRAVTIHNGQINFKSTPTDGTRFDITLPTRQKKLNQ